MHGFSLTSHYAFVILNQFLDITLSHGFHISWKVVDFFLKIPGPGKSWKNIVENHAFFRRIKWKTSSNSTSSRFVDCCLLKYCTQQFKKFSNHFARLDTCFSHYIQTFMHHEKGVEILPWGTCKVLKKSWIFLGLEQY